MYRFNVYLDFPHGEFKFLETTGFFAESREEAEKIALKYAQEKYKDWDVSVMSVNWGAKWLEKKR